MINGMDMGEERKLFLKVCIVFRVSERGLKGSLTSEEKRRDTRGAFCGKRDVF
jgi:hypothetical protein